VLKSQIAAWRIWHNDGRHVAQFITSDLPRACIVASKPKPSTITAINYLAALTQIEFAKATFSRIKE
jgi:hypothetical protein